MMMPTARCRHSTARTSWAAMLWLTKRVHHVRAAAVAVEGEEAAVVAEAAEGVAVTAAAVVAVEAAVVAAAEAVVVVAEEAGEAAGISL
jgi:hypothetical protein